MKNILNKINNFLNILNEKHIGEITANCAYYTLLAFIPLLMLILTLTKYFGIEPLTLSNVISRLFLSNKISGSAIEIVQEVYSKSFGTITISAIFVLWSAGKGFFALCKGLHTAYDVANKKFVYYRIKATICTIIFIALIISMLLLVVFGNSINIVLQERFNIFSKIINLILKSKILISVILLFVVFILVYKFIPKNKYKIKEHIPGAIFASISCTAISIFYSIYVDVYTGFSLMYGSLTIIVLAMMWVYACMYCILVGAVINKYLIDTKQSN